MEARDVVLVVLDGVEWHGKREVSEVDMDATAATGCTKGHLELFEVVVLDALLKLAEEKVVGDLVLLGEAGRIDGLDAGEVELRSRWWRVAEAASE